MDLKSTEHKVMVCVDTALPGEALPSRCLNNSQNSQSVVVVQRNLTYENLLELQEVLKGGIIDSLLELGRKKLAAKKAEAEQVMSVTGLGIGGGGGVGRAVTSPLP